MQCTRSSTDDVNNNNNDKLGEKKRIQIVITLKPGKVHTVSTEGLFSVSFGLDAYCGVAGPGGVTATFGTVGDLTFSTGFACGFCGGSGDCFDSSRCSTFATGTSSDCEGDKNKAKSMTSLHNFGPKREASWCRFINSPRHRKYL